MFSLDSYGDNLFLDSVNTRVLILGTVFFLYLSFTRGLIYVALSLLFPIFPQTVIVLIALSPILILLIPVEHENFWLFTVPVSTVMWLIGLFFSNLIILLIVILIGSALTYGSIRYILLLSIQEERGNEIIKSIFIAILFDMVLKGLNNGTDPFLYTTLIVKVITAILIIYVLAIMFYNQEDLLGHYIEFQLDLLYHKNIVIGRNLALLGFFQGLLVYTIYFANSGPLSLSLDLSGPPSTSLTIFMTLVLVYLTIWQYMNFIKDDRVVLIIISSFVILLSILTFPWYNMAFVLWPLGLISLTIILANNLLNSNIIDQRHVKSLNFSIILGLSLNILFIQQVVQVDSIYLHLVIIMILIFYSIISQLLTIHFKPIDQSTEIRA